jgi:hypothetical protein
VLEVNAASLRGREASRSVWSAKPKSSASRHPIDPTRRYASFFEKRDLPVQDQVLRGYGLVWLEKEGREPTDVGQQPQKESHQQDHEIMMPQAYLLSRELRASNILRSTAGIRSK